jgi:trk system potassium uptake protein TrkH
MTSERTPARPGAPGLRGRLPGDRRVRVERRTPRGYTLRPPKQIRRPPHPALVVVAGFAVLIGLGTLLLMLPAAAASGASTSPVDALFTATSAVCITGLVVVDTGTHWSGFGQVVILVLIQLGGFAFMAGSTVLLFLLVGRRTRLRDRLLVQMQVGAVDLGSVSWLLRRIAVFTIVAEVVGFVALLIAFIVRGEDAATSAWWALFHSVSAFNNAGFDVMGGFRSFTAFASDPLVLIPLALLFIVGGLGYAIVGDIARHRGWRRLALESKVVILTSVALLAVGTVAIGLVEWSNPATLGALAEHDRVVNAAFQSATARSAGFNSVPVNLLDEAALIVLLGLMFIGGASGSTAGGIKVNTFSVLLIAMVSSARGDPSAVAFGRRIPHAVVYRAISVVVLSIALAFAVAVAIELATDVGFLDVVFETVSSVATVGLSTGVTPELPGPARLLISAVMLIGRLGPLTLVVALAARARPVPYRPAVESIRIG